MSTAAPARPRPASASTWAYPYSPSPGPQTRLHACTADEVLYGGAGGGGKTDALLAAGVSLCLAVPGCKVLLLRRSFPELEQEILPRLMQRIPPTVAKYHAGSHTFTFWNGAILRLGYLERYKDVYRYSGAEYQLILWDELTGFSLKQYEFLRTRLRAAGAVALRLRELGTRPRMMSATNPGGPGHGWVKRTFYDPAPAETEHTYRRTPESTGITRIYIPAKATDNPYLDQVEYQKQLDSIEDDFLRRALRDGDWDILEGVRFPTFRRSIHVIRPAELPIPLVGYPRAVGVDYGMSAPFAAVWGALVGETVVVYREVCKADLTATEQARRIIALEVPGERIPSRPIPVALDPATWARSHIGADRASGDLAPVGSIAWSYQEVLGPSVIKANNHRVSGWALVDRGLRVKADGLPGLLIYDTCPELIRTITELMRSDQNPEDADTDGDDHLPDALRYLLYQLVGGGHRRVADDPLESDPLAGRDVSAPLVDARF